MSNIRLVIEHYGGRINSSNKACCAIHGEVTPSLHVYDDTESWHCYGACGSGGDAIEFIRQVEGCSFKEAVTKMAGILEIEEEEVREMLFCQLHHAFRRLTRPSSPIIAKAST